MPDCPLCSSPLHTVRQREGVYFGCQSCGGRALTVPQIRRMAGDQFATAMLRKINSAQVPSPRLCPFCTRPMKQFEIPSPQLSLDSCKTCGSVWFDPAEFETVPSAAVESASELHMRGREAIALHTVERIAREQKAEQSCPDEPWKWLPGFLGMPVELDDSRLSRFPWATWTVALVIIAVSLSAFSRLESIVQDFGMIPEHFWRYGGITSLTSFFLHGGIMHLVGNVYFLAVLGDNVEDYLGRARFLLLLFGATLAGDILHTLADPASSTPCIGASGGISGIVAFYGLAFPHARLAFVWRIHWFQLPAWGAFGIWVLMQVFGAWTQLNGLSNVSALAHLGGAAVGVAYWCWDKRSRRSSSDNGKTL